MYAFETHATLAQRWEHWLAECNACLSALRRRSVQCVLYGGLMWAHLSVNLGLAFYLFSHAASELRSRVRGRK